MVYIQETHQIHASQVKAHVSEVCLMPPDTSYGDAALMVYPFISGLRILHRELGISLASMKPDSDISDVRTALILGGEGALANAITQLFCIALPSTSLLVACRMEEEVPPKVSQEAVRPFCIRAIEIGAKYSIDASAPNLLEHLRLAIVAYGGSLRLILDATGEIKRPPEILDLLEASGKFVDCTQRNVIAAIPQNDEGATMTCLGRLLAANMLRPPLRSDMFATTL